MTVFRDKNIYLGPQNNSLPAKQVFKPHFIYKAGWRAKGVKGTGRYWVWIGLYQIGWNIP